MSDDIKERAAKIKLLLMDCDGVLTDGRLYFTEVGETIKVFHVRDGQGLVSWHGAGYRSGIISGRNSKIVETRAKELSIDFIRQGAEDKIKAFEEIIAVAGVSQEETAFVGDDLADVPVLCRVGFAFAVADAAREVKQVAHFITETEGGRGAVREITDLLLSLKNNV